MKHKVEFASHTANLSMVRRIVRQFMEDFHFTSKEVELMVLGVDEACTNIIRHVYKHEATHLIGLACERLENGVRFRLRDYGPQMPEPHRLSGRPLDVVQPGGLGLHLIRSAFDHVDFHSKEKGTELVLTKHFAGQGNNNHHRHQAA